MANLKLNFISIKIISEKIFSRAHFTLSSLSIQRNCAIQINANNNHGEKSVVFFLNLSLHQVQASEGNRINELN